MLETMRTHKDSAHKLRLDLLDAEKNHGDTMRQMAELEHEIVQRQTRVDELQSTLAKISGLVSSLKVLEARRDALVAENTRRLDALSQEVDVPLEELLAIQVRATAAGAVMKMRRRVLLRRTAAVLCCVPHHLTAAAACATVALP